MSPGQCKAARFLLNWSQRELAKKSGVAPLTIGRYENGQSIRSAMQRVIAQTLENAGIEFLTSAGESGVSLVALDDGSGVALRKREKEL